MRDVWIFVGIFAMWIVLNRWVVPRCGIPTCMSGACARPPQVEPVKLQKSAGKAAETGPDASRAAAQHAADSHKT